MSLASAKIYKHPKTGEFYLVAPNNSKEKIEGSFEEAWEKLSKAYSDNQVFFTEIGLEDEVDQFDSKKIFGKGFWVSSLVKGLVIMVPILFGFFLFSFALTNQLSKLVGKIQAAISPYSERAAREELGYKQTLERYRPYIFETIKVIKEEEAKAEKATKEK